MAEGGRWQGQPLRMGMGDTVVRLYNTVCVYEYPTLSVQCVPPANHAHTCRQVGPLCTCTRARFFTRSTGFPDLPVPFACDCHEQKSEATFFGNGRVLAYTNGKDRPRAWVSWNGVQTMLNAEDGMGSGNCSGGGRLCVSWM